MLKKLLGIRSPDTPHGYAQLTTLGRIRHSFYFRMGGVDGVYFVVHTDQGITTVIPRYAVPTVDPIDDMWDDAYVSACSTAQRFVRDVIKRMPARRYCV